MIKRLAIIVTLAALVPVGAALALRSPQSHAAVSPVQVPKVAVKVAHAATQARCALPAPSTARGFAKLFSSINTAEWGAADVSISVPLPDGRSVWLYGDTFEQDAIYLKNGALDTTKPWRMPHSTSIVQDGGCLHVSNGGNQLLPNDDATHIYWITSATALTGTWNNWLHVTARSITITGKGAWSFSDNGFSRTASVYADPATGNVTFINWNTKTVGPPASSPLINCEAPAYPIPHHVCYAHHTHPEFNLASGKTLATTCQNWDDGLPHPLSAFRPIFTEE